MKNPFQGLKLCKSRYASSVLQLSVMKNPFQGLKLNHLSIFFGEFSLSVMKNPFQGLKLCQCHERRSKKCHRLSVMKNPFQGLKRKELRAPVEVLTTFSYEKSLFRD